MKTRRMSLKIRLVIYISVLCVFCCSIMSWFMYLRVRKTMIEQSKTDAMGLASVAASEIDGTLYEMLTSEDDEYFGIAYNELSKYKNTGMFQYIYAMRMQGSTLQFVIDTDTNEPVALGEVYDMPEDMQPAFSGQVCCDEEVTSDEWGTYFSAYAPIKTSDGKVVGVVGCDISIDSINKDLRGIQLLAINVAIVASIFCIIAANIIGTNIGNNLKLVYSKVQELNSGNGDLTKHIEITSGDELEEIANAFNEFIEQIRSMVEGVSHTSGNVEGNSVSVMEAVEGCNHQIRRINVALGNMSSKMQETNASTNLIAESLHQTVDKVAGLNQQATESSQDAFEISNNAMKIRDDVILVEQQAKQMIETMQASLMEAQENCKEIEKIDDITAQILKVANKTQILALNANIEAARAGTYGKGFSVIATDVSHLSQQISGMVENIQNTNQSVKTAVEQLTSGLENVSNFLNESILNDYHKFVQIGDDYSSNMSQMAQVLESFHQTTDDINNGITAIQENVTEIDHVVDAATQGISELHSRGVKMKDNMDQLSELSSQNTNESKNLTARVKQYIY